MHLRKTTLVITSFALTIIVLNFYSCKKNNTGETIDPFAALSLPSTAYNYANQALPAFLRTPLINGQDNTPATNPVTDWGATLGRVLFYDKVLSINNSVSCASCHKQSFSFTDNAAFSKGFAGGLTTRNSMQL